MREQQFSKTIGNSGASYSIYNRGIIVILVPESVKSNHNNSLMYQNFKIVLDFAIC